MGREGPDAGTSQRLCNHTPMNPIILSNRKIRTPGMMYGTAWKKADTARLVTLAIRTGFRAIDAACQPKRTMKPAWALASSPVLVRD